MMLDQLQYLCERQFAHSNGQSGGGLASLTLIRRDQTSALEAVVYNPLICLILQGGKTIDVGQRSVTVTRGEALLVSHDLPVSSRITEASLEAPYLALVLPLDIAMIRGLYEQVADALPERSLAKSLCAFEADGRVIDPLLRYMRLCDMPLEAKVLGPMILKELHFQLLLSPIGGMLRQMLSIDSHASRISKAIRQIRATFRTSLNVGELAHSVGMSQSSFHEHFKSVTGTTPLQYQKDLRMIEARSILATGRTSVSATGFEVGYESPTHFSRDYARKFGCSPKHHLA